MKKILYLSLTTILLIGCVSQSEYDKLQEENEKLKQENEMQLEKIVSLTSKLEELENEKIKAEIEKNKVKWYSKDEAMNYVKDYYQFYKTDLYFKNAKTRRVSDNEFLISLTECLKSVDHCYSKVYRLTIDKEGNYKMNY